MEFKIFKIYNIDLKMYARSGSDLDSSHWSKTGKCWSNLGHLKLHLRNIAERYDPNHFYYNKEETLRKRKSQGWIYKNCEIHVYSSDTPMISFPANQVLADMMDKKTGKTLKQVLIEVYG